MVVAGTVAAMLCISAAPAITAGSPQRFLNVSVTNGWFGANWIEVGKPFDADTEEIWITRYPGNEGKTVDRGKIHVSAEGRLRIESGPAGARFAWIGDPARSMSWLIDLSSNEVLWQSAEDGAPSPARAPHPGLGPSAERVEERGRRRIAGQECQGYRRLVRGIGRPGGPLSVAGVQRDTANGVEDFVVETWTSLELGQVVLETRVSEHETATLRMLRVRRRAQDPALFRIPALVSRQVIR